MTITDKLLFTNLFSKLYAQDFSAFVKDIFVVHWPFPESL